MDFGVATHLQIAAGFRWQGLLDFVQLRFALQGHLVQVIDLLLVLRRNGPFEPDKISMMMWSWFRICLDYLTGKLQILYITFKEGSGGPIYTLRHRIQIRLLSHKLSVKIKTVPCK